MHSSITMYMDHLPNCNIKQDWSEADCAFADTPHKFRDGNYDMALQELVDKKNTCTCGLDDAKNAVEHYTAPLVLDREQFDRLLPGEIIKSVITKQQTVIQSFSLVLKLVAVKGDLNDWAIYAYHPHATDRYVIDHGDKVVGKALILSICPCTPEIFALYRY